MTRIEPIPNHPAAVIDDEARFLVIADYHAGFEAALRYEEGVELRSRAPARKQRLLDLLDRIAPDRLLVLGDLTHSIGEPGGAERAELEVLFEEIDIPVTVAKGNHDGDLEAFAAADQEHFGNLSITSTGGQAIESFAVAHGHTWPDPEVLASELLCIGHEHPSVRLVDEVGGHRVERVWLRGKMSAEPFAARYDRSFASMPELVVVPAFNDLVGGTWVNDSEQDFLSPFLPEGLADARIYLLDGTNLGPRHS